MPEPDFFIKQNDTIPAIVRILEDANGDPVDVSQGTVEFKMQPIEGGTLIGGSAQFVTDGTDGQVQYNWEDDDTAFSGLFIAEWEVTIGTAVETFPNGGYDLILITGDTPVGGGPIGVYTSSISAHALAAASAVGATSVSLNSTDGINAGDYVVLDPYGLTAEIRKVSSISGSTVNLTSGNGSGGYGITTLQYAHDVDSQVKVLDDHRPIPWEWWGAVRGTSTQTVADDNTTGFNRLTQQLYSISAQRGISVGAGTYWVSDELRIERDQPIIGISPTASQIVAHSSFEFDTSGEKAVIHSYRDGSPATFNTPGPSGRWYFQDLFVNCNNVTDSCGILSSPQQPDQSRRIRIDAAVGAYGLGLNDVQYHDIHGLELNNCAVGVYLNSCAYVRIYSMAHTSTTDTIVKLVNVTDSSFYGALLENLPTGGTMVDVSGTSNRLHFDSFYTSGFTGGSTGDVFKFDCASANPEGKCTYLITNSGCAQNSATINFVHDVQRSLTFNTFADTQRGLIMGWTKGDHYWFVLDGKVVTNGGFQLGASGSALKAETVGATSVADGGTITHGLGVTPDVVTATPSTSGEFVAVTAKGATTFTVAIKKHDGSAGTTQTVYWRAIDT